MWLSNVYGPHMAVCTPNNIWACSWWDGGWCILGYLLPYLNQGISELLDSLWCYLAATDALMHNVPDLLNWIQVWGTWGPVSGINAFIIQELPTHYGHIWPGVVLHQEEPMVHCTSGKSDNGSQVFHPSSKQQSGYHWLAHGDLCDPWRIRFPRSSLTQGQAQVPIYWPRPTTVKEEKSFASKKDKYKQQQ